MTILEDVLIKHAEEIGSVIDIDLNKEKMFVFDFTGKNKELQKIKSAGEFDKFVKNVLRYHNATIGIGGYNEDRVIYRRSPLFAERTVHLGIDIIVPTGTQILAPLDALVHSFQNNKAYGDYGPTIILQHELDGIIFYTLYGHLSEESLDKTEGQRIEKGAVIGKIGSTEINGNWFEHLHFQIVNDMLGMKGDFPGVTSTAQRQSYLKLCPDPNLILKIGNLYTT